MEVAVDGMKVLVINKQIAGKTWDKAFNSDVVIFDGTIIKNRDGKTGIRLGGAIFIWDERPYDQHDRAGEEAVPCGNIARWGDGDI